MLYRKGIGISKVIDVLGYCMLGMWVTAEQLDININRLANLFSSEMFSSNIYSKTLTSRHLNAICFYISFFPLNPSI